MTAGRAVCALLALAALASCGQRGPLTLPDSARPIERVPAPAAPAEDDERDDDER
jgi:predicted small lipoprotein YifL